MSKANDLSNSSDHFTNFASGIKFAFKGKLKGENKLTHSEFYPKDEYSCDIELEEKPEIGGKYRNENKFKPSTKQTIDQNEYKKLKKKYAFEEIEEQIEEEQIKDDKDKDDNSLNKIEKSETPKSKINKNNVHTEKYRLNKIIFDDDEEQDDFEKNIKKKKKKFEEDLDFDFDDSNESEKENNRKKENNKNKKNKKGKNKNNKNNKKKNNKKKRGKSKDSNKDSSDNHNDEYEEKNNDKKEEEENVYNYKESKGIKSEGGDFNHVMKFKKRVYKKSKKWDEDEYQKLLSESKNYIPFKNYDIKQFLLTKYQLKNIKQIPELYDKYLEFISLKEKHDKIQVDILVKNILQIFNNIYKKNHISLDFTVNSLFKNQDWAKIDYKSSEKTAYFDLFISFISLYTSDYQSFVESSSILDTTKLIIPLHSLAFIFSSQYFFSDIARLIQNYYNKYLSYKIIPIYKNENEDYIHKINSRKIIWKQFESPFLYYKNKKNLYLKEDDGKSKLDEKKIDDFANKVSENINEAYNNFAENIIVKHRNINVFNIDDKKINLTNVKTSVPSSLYNQINGDVLFKVKMNLYKFRMKQLKIKKLCKINEAKMKMSEFNNVVKNKIFRNPVYYMNPCDVVQDFLENFN